MLILTPLFTFLLVFRETSLRMRPFNMADPFGMFERHRAALTGPGREMVRSYNLYFKFLRFRDLG